MGRFLVLFFISAFLFSCSDDVPEGVLPPETMVPLLTDFHVANGYSATLYGFDNAAKLSKVYNALYRKYAVDSVGLRKSLIYYSERPEVFTLIYDKVEKRLNQLQEDEQKRLALETKISLQKIAREKDLANRKLIFIEFRKRVAQGKYDFGASAFKTPADAYFKRWRPLGKSVPLPQSDLDSLKTDSLKKFLLKLDRR